MTAPAERRHILTVGLEDYFQVGFDPTYAAVQQRTFYVRGNYRF